MSHDTAQWKGVRVGSSEQEYFFLKKDKHGEDFIESFDEVMIVAIDQDESVLFTHEFSPAFAHTPVLILPGGTAEDNEPPEVTANRELQEEIGMRANHLEYLGELWPWSKYLTVRSHLFLARDLVPSRLPGDEAEPVEMVRIPWNEIDPMVADGRLNDARAIAALYRVRLALGAPKGG
jgi:ADP-ribose diphosphatase